MKVLMYRSSMCGHMKHQNLRVLGNPFTSRSIESFLIEREQSRNIWRHTSFAYQVTSLWRLPSCFALIQSPGSATGQRSPYDVTPLRSRVYVLRNTTWVYVLRNTTQVCADIVIRGRYGQRSPFDVTPHLHIT